MAPRAKAKSESAEDAIDQAAEALAEQLAGTIVSGAATVVPNSNPALTVAVLGDAPTFLPIIGWSIGEDAPVPITPNGEQALDDAHVLHDNAQRKYLIDGKWVKEP
jgi:hypothetical protein